MTQIRPKAFFFDFDGVVVDSERQHMIATLETLKDKPEMLFDEDYYFEVLLGFDDIGMYQFLWNRAKTPLSDGELKELLAVKNRHLMRRLESESCFFPGVIDFITLFGEKNIPIAVVSGARRKEILACMQKGALEPRFEFVVSADDVARSKPDPESYEKAYWKMREKVPTLAREDCWVMEDSPAGIESAKGAGLRVIGITNSLKREHLKGADFIVDRYSQVDIL